MKTSATAIFVICLSTIIWGGCAQETKVIKIPEAPVVTGMKSSRTITIEGDLRQEKFEFANSVKGKPIEKIVISHKDSEILDERVILFVGGIVGTEPIGTPIITRMIEHIKTQPQLLKNRKVIFLPQVNPDGVESHSRENAKGVDINRDFPKNKENFGECQPETQAVIETIDTYKPESIITVHQSEGIDFDFPDETLKERNDMIRYLKQQNPGLLFKYDSVKPGSLGEYGSKILEIPVISFGVGKYETDKKKLWEKYRNGLIALITYPDGGDQPQKQEEARGEEQREPSVIRHEDDDDEKQPVKTPEDIACDNGKSLFRKGNYSTAKENLNSCRDDKKSINYLKAVESYEKGMRLYGSDDCDGAIVEFKKVLSLNKNDKKLKDYIRKCSKVLAKNNEPAPKKKAEPTHPITEESLDSDKAETSKEQVKEADEKELREAVAKQRETEKEQKEADEKQMREAAAKQKEAEKEQKESEKQKSFEDFFQQAQDSFSRADYASAKENFEKAAQIKNCNECKENSAKSEKAKAAYDLGHQAFKGSNYKKAIGHFEEVIKINPKDHKSKDYISQSKQKIYEKGKKHFLEKRFDDTIAVLSQLDAGYTPPTCTECKTAGDIINLAQKVKEKEASKKKE